MNAADAAKLTIATGGQLKAEQIFVGEGASDIGKLDITGGAIVVDAEYIGHRGQGSVAHTGGSNTAGRIIVGKDNDGLGATYTLTGAASAGSAPVVNTGSIVIGDQDSSSGEFIISGGSYAIVNSEAVVVGEHGEGVFTQQKGQLNVSGDLVIGKESASDGTYSLYSPGTLTTGNTIVGEDGEGAFYHSGGKLTTGTLSIGANGHYVKTGGTTEAKDVEIAGEFLHMGGTLVSREIVGEIDFVNSDSVVKATGLAHFENATFTNALNTELLVDEESLVLLSSAGQFGYVTPLGDLTTHVVGSTLAIGAGGFRGKGTITDPVELYDGGYAVATSDPGIYRELRFEGGVTAVSGESSLSRKGLSLMVFGGQGLQIDSGASLAIGGGVGFNSNSAKMNVDGEISIVPLTSSQGALYIKGDSNLTQTVLDFGSNATLSLVAKGNDDSQYDRIEIESTIAIVNANLDGELAIELDSYDPSPRDLLRIIDAYDDVNISGHFSTVTVDGGDTILNSLDVAMAVLYDWSGAPGDVVVRASLPGDFNLDDSVDPADVALWSTNFGLTNATWVDGDANGDGAVDMGDWGALQLYLGSSWPSLLSVPEPSSAAMLLCCGTLLGSCRVARKRA
ncbi:hypothetical protein [Lacipirellula sp.]|uniref:hypothetical protein n=1 Tax=Lacipirellula sp. TaxID=2691419 RepID=UPI003D10EB95